jgi:hypothetical protein
MSATKWDPFDNYEDWLADKQEFLTGEAANPVEEASVHSPGVLKSFEAANPVEEASVHSPGVPNDLEQELDKVEEEAISDEKAKLGEAAKPVQEAPVHSPGVPNDLEQDLDKVEEDTNSDRTSVFQIPDEEANDTSLHMPSADISAMFDDLSGGEAKSVEAATSVEESESSGEYGRQWNVANTSAPSQHGNDIGWQDYHTILVAEDTVSTDLLLSGNILNDTKQEVLLMLVKDVARILPLPRSALYMIDPGKTEPVHPGEWNIHVVPTVQHNDGILYLDEAILLVSHQRLANEYDPAARAPLVSLRDVLGLINAQQNLVDTRLDYRGYCLSSTEVIFSHPVIATTTPYPSWALAGAGLGTALMTVLLLLSTQDGQRAQVYTSAFFASRCLPDQPIGPRLITEALVLTVQRVPASAVFRGATGQRRKSSRLLCRTVRQLLHPGGQGSLRGIVVVSILLATLVSLGTLKSGSERARLVGATTLSAFVLLFGGRWWRRSARQQEKQWNRIMGDTHTFLVDNVKAAQGAQNAFVDYFQDPLLPMTTTALRSLLGVTHWHEAWQAGQTIVGDTVAEQRLLAIRTFRRLSGGKGLPLSAVVDVAGEELGSMALTTSVIATILAMEVTQRGFALKKGNTWHSVEQSILKQPPVHPT